MFIYFGLILKYIMTPIYSITFSIPGKERMKRKETKGE